LGNTQRIFGRNKFYVKNTAVIEKLAEISSIVFDKTGTITETFNSKIKFEGKELAQTEVNIIRALVLNSSHPLSILIASTLKATKKIIVEEYSEKSGKGISGIVDGKKVLIGSQKFVFQNSKNNSENISTTVFISINGKELGYFKISNIYRKGLKEIISSLQNKYKLFVLSGDNDGERESLKNYFPKESSLNFNQSPQDTLNFISQLQKENEKVLMIGDGLNDAGALVKSDVGISISEDVNNFSPACDGIMDAKSFKNIKEFIKFSSTSKKIIIASFVISFIYNFIGIGFAVQGTLSPVISAILMPISSITIVVFTTLATNIIAKKRSLL